MLGPTAMGPHITSAPSNSTQKWAVGQTVGRSD
jgi:hypothetical protein